MTRRANSLHLVTSALRGRLPAPSDWPVLLELSTRGWLTPALFVAFEAASCLDEIPDDVLEYITLLHDRNVERNSRLRAQLIEALEALNAADVEPILLKGGIKLFRRDSTGMRARMISDLDLNVQPSEVARTKEALWKLGYRPMPDPREFGRPQDVGVIELHDRPNVRSARYLAGDLRDSAPVTERDDVRARVPTPTAQAIHLIVHDMIKEGDFWRLTTNLRHLHDLAELAKEGESVDWSAVAAILGDRTGRAALALQLRALRQLFGVDVPVKLCGNLVDALRHQARLRAAQQDAAGSLIRVTGRVLWGSRRFKESYRWRGGRDFGRRVHSRLTESPKASTL